jgi:hypothetical protein
MQQRAGLLGDGARDARMRVAQPADRDAGQRVEIALAVGILEPVAGAAGERHGQPLVGFHQMGHANSPSRRTVDVLRVSAPDLRMDGGRGWVPQNDNRQRELPGKDATLLNLRTDVNAKRPPGSGLERAAETLEPLFEEAARAGEIEAHETGPPNDAPSDRPTPCCFQELARTRARGRAGRSRRGRSLPRESCARRPRPAPARDCRAGIRAGRQPGAAILECGERGGVGQGPMPGHQAPWARTNARRSSGSGITAIAQDSPGML